MDKDHTTQHICTVASLCERAHAVRFEAEQQGQRLPGIVIRFAGGIHAWRNTCPHRGTELDWEPGQVFDASGNFLICATHGAMFEPNTGRCVVGACHGDSLTRIPIKVEDGQVSLLQGFVVPPALPPSPLTL